MEIWLIMVFFVGWKFFIGDCQSRDEVAKHFIDQVTCLPPPHPRSPLISIPHIRPIRPAVPRVSGAPWHERHMNFVLEHAPPQRDPGTRSFPGFATERNFFSLTFFFALGFFKNSLSSSRLFFYTLFSEATAGRGSDKKAFRLALFLDLEAALDDSGTEVCFYTLKKISTLSRFLSRSLAVQLCECENFFFF